MNTKIHPPFPYVIHGTRQPGSLFDWPEPCRKCPTRECEKTTLQELSICSYGFNFQRVHQDLVIAGFIADKFPTSTPARTKNYKSYRDNVVQAEHIAHVASYLVDAMGIEAKELGQEKTRLIDEYVTKERYKLDFLQPFKEQILKGLSFVHDYKQINAQIAQNINVIIETRYIGDTFEDKLSKAEHAEKAIYWASKFLQEKLNVARFLLQPEWINKESEKTSFRFHGLLLKYLRIYQHMFDGRQIAVHVRGESRRNLFGNAEAIGVIPHTFLDNALKYSRPRSKVDIFVNDEPDGIYLSVGSYGPRIESDEASKLFAPFYRGKEAAKMQEEGAGYGLYVAQLIARQLGTLIKVEQDSFLKERLGHWTNFSVLLPYT